MKKKLVFLIMLIFSISIFTSCDRLTEILNNVNNDDNLSSDPIPSVSVEPSVMSTQDIGDLSFTKVNFGNRLDIDGPKISYPLPSTGTPNILVIPINLDNNNATNEKLLDINYAFNGTSDETGWESVKSYYQKSSYNQLDLQIEVINQWYTPKYEASYYENYLNKYNEKGNHLLLDEALEYYNEQYDYSYYDSDKDGSIDSIWLIYNHSVDYENNDFYWAYASTNPNSDKYDGVKAYRFAFAGIDFIHPTIQEAGTYNPEGINYDAHAYIHETGHLMGLDDYYDYFDDKGAVGGTYGADMMDYNVGDHGMISKLLLGWVQPIVVSGTGSASFGLESFAETGKFILISDHEVTSIYDEYFLIEFYNSDGLNERDNLIPNASGIRVMHIDARKNIVDGEAVYNSGNYRSGFLYDNSDEEKLFCNTLRSDYYNSDTLTKSSFYGKLDTFGYINYTDYKMHSGSSIPFKFNVLSVHDNQIDIKLTIE
ncbi:MAG: hypothetical protein IJY14_03700 [Acholeplasmatales bacterium]|nr:hypothetical protein [Acholeplasmatales bacterium]